MRLKNILYALPVATLLAGCGEGGSDTPLGVGTVTTGNTIISGNIKNANSALLFLDKLAITSANIADTLRPAEDGSFTFNVAVDNFGFYRLRFDQNNFVNLILQEGENVSFNADAVSLEGTYAVTGSPETDRLRELNQVISKMYFKRDSLNKAIQQHKMGGDMMAYGNAQSYMMGLQDQLGQFIRNFIATDPQSLANLAAVENLNPETDYEHYKIAAEGLETRIPNSPYFTSLKTRVTEYGKLAAGAVAPDIVASDLDGNSKTLSSLQGNVVLVDFWASWCRPCRAENPNVVKAYNKYKDKGFTVLSVSLDGIPNQKDPKGAWQQAIAQDGLLWPNHISELAGWNSSFIPTYKIQGIPLTYLIDRDGKILAKNLRGPQLEAKLEELFSTS